MRKAAVVLLAVLSFADQAGWACDCALYNSAIIPSLPVKRDGSGTSWLPDSSPVHAFFFQQGPWDVMYHGNVTLSYISEHVKTSRQSDKSDFFSTNWVMGKVARNVGNVGRLMLTGTMDLEPLTVGGRGYPELFQTGETWRDKRLVDRQHPHDLFHELAAAYSISPTSEDTFFLYLGLPGEPALGPPAFVHRPSALSNASTPLGHHWQDSTHVSFGVATLGWRSNSYKFEVSGFRGREPDERRWDFDKPKFDSVALRESINPMRDLAMQASVGFIKSPDKLTPRDDETRANISIVYNRALPNRGNWATTLSYGGNSHISRSVTPPHSNFLRAALAESEWFTPRWSLYGRAEVVQKFIYQLEIPGMDQLSMIDVKSGTLGVSKTLSETDQFLTSIGVQGSAYLMDKSIKDVYGSGPYIIQTYLRFFWGKI